MVTLQMFVIIRSSADAEPICAPNGNHDGKVTHVMVTTFKTVTGFPES